MRQGRAPLRARRRVRSKRAMLQWCQSSEHRVPVHVRGGNTGLVGGFGFRYFFDPQGNSEPPPIAAPPPAPAHRAEPAPAAPPPSAEGTEPAAAETPYWEQ